MRKRLRTYRYSDENFSGAEKNKIYFDFEKLEYNKHIVTKAKISAKQGIAPEIMIMLELVCI